MDQLEFNTHNNIDTEIIRINKNSLFLHFKEIQSNSSIPTEAATYGGLFLTLLTSAFLTEKFHDLWSIPGETIRSAFLVGAIISLLYSIYNFMSWYKNRNKFTPEGILESLVNKKIKPLALLESPKIFDSKVNVRNKRFVGADKKISTN